MTRHIASGLLGVDTNLEQQLDAVQATYFSQALSTEDFSSESESELSDDEDCDDLFEGSLAPRLINESNIAVNTSEGDTEVIDQAVSAFLGTTCGCRFGPSQQPCSNLFSEAAVFEVRS